SRGVEAAFPGHGEIHQDHVGTRRRGQGDRLAARLGLADDDEARLLFQERPQAGTHDGVIVCQDDSDLFPSAAADVEHGAPHCEWLRTDSKNYTPREGAASTTTMRRVLRRRYGNCQISTRFPGSEGINSRFRFAS